MFAALSALALGLAVRTSGVALADGFLNCSPGQSLSSYKSNGCAYSSPGYTQVGDDNVYVPYWITPCGNAGAGPFPSNIVSQIRQGAANWSNSVADVIMWEVPRGTSCTAPNYTNLLRVYPDWNDFGSGTACNNTWGLGWDGGSGDRGQVLLNAHLFASCPNGWVGLSGHEMGHDMGMGHNNYNNCSQLMCASCACVSGPQSADISIFNAIYPLYSTSCPNAPSNFNCNNTDYIQQGCNHYAQSGAYSDSYITVTLEYSTNCQSNFTSTKINGGNAQLYKVDIERGGNSTQWPAYTLTETPSGGATSWYTNSIWSPNNPARSCAWYVIPPNARIYGPFCSSWV
jgi:hypothetical protein